ncbi:MAG: glycosyltransferase [Acidimicrobiales bacterium]
MNSEADVSGAPLIAVATCTFRRPEGLRRLYEGLAAMDLPSDVSLALITIDNAGDVELPNFEGDWPSVIEVEHERGIPFARNRAVSVAARLGADALVFFDDDEVPRPDCLVRLVETWRTTGASVVQGSSVPRFDVAPPAWVEAGAFFERNLPTDGQPIQAFHARTSNVLIDMNVFSVADPPFDTRLRLTGGSDSYLFRVAAEAGCRFVAAGSALVDETVPASRVSARWLVKRHYRVGWGRSYYLRSRSRDPLKFMKRLAAGLLGVAVAPKRAWQSRQDPRLAAVQAARQAAYSVGLIVGMLGRKPAEYKDLHGA